jgi:hypothetical protein
VPVYTSVCPICEEKGANTHWISWRKSLVPPSLSSSSAPPPSSPSLASPSASRAETTLSLTRRRAVSAFVPASPPSAVDEGTRLEHVVRARSWSRPVGGARGACEFRHEKRIGRVGRDGSRQVVVVDAIGELRASYPGRRVAAASSAEGIEGAGAHLPASRRPVGAENSHGIHGASMSPELDIASAAASRTPDVLTEAGCRVRPATAPAPAPATQKENECRGERCPTRGGARAQRMTPIPRKRRGEADSKHRGRVDVR